MHDIRGVREEHSEHADPFISGESTSPVPLGNDTLIASADFECRGYVKGMEDKTISIDIFGDRTVIVFRESYRSGVIRVICPKIDSDGICHPRGVASAAKVKCPYRSTGV